MAAAAEGIASSIINVDHRATTTEDIGSAEVPVKRSATFMRSQIAGQLGTPLISEKKHTTDFARAHETLEVIKSL